MLRVTARRHDVSAFRLFDPREQEMPPVGRVRLKDLETGKMVLLDTSSATFQAEFGQMIKRRQLGLKKIFDAARVDYAEYSTAEKPVQTLVRFFAKKKKRRWSR